MVFFAGNDPKPAPAAPAVGAKVSLPGFNGPVEVVGPSAVKGAGPRVDAVRSATVALLSFGEHAGIPVEVFHNALAYALASMSDHHGFSPEQTAEQVRLVHEEVRRMVAEAQE